jgi:hypothetical protein
MRILNSLQLAELLSLSPLTIHSTLVRHPDKLPPPVRVPGSNRLHRLEADVNTGLESHQAKASTAPRKGGRPYKQLKNISQ